jgi:hypothetical protein
VLFIQADALVVRKLLKSEGAVSRMDASQTMISFCFILPHPFGTLLGVPGKHVSAAASWAAFVPFLLCVVRIPSPIAAVSDICLTTMLTERPLVRRALPCAISSLWPSRSACSAGRSGYDKRVDSAVWPLSLQWIAPWLLFRPA